MDEPSRWERLFVANLQRPASEWARRQRRVRVVQVFLAGGTVAVALLSLAVADLRTLPGLALVAVLALAVVLVQNLWLYMGILRGAAEREQRERVVRGP